MADPTEIINQAASNLGNAGGAAQQLAELLQQAAKAAGGNATAASASAQAMQGQAGQATSLGSKLGSLTGQIPGVVTGLVGVSTSAYGADKAFTSVIPTLDTMASTISSMITALGQMTSGVTIAGFSIGRAGEGAAALANMGFEVLHKSLKFQIEGAQKVTDNFHRLTMIGATFGGSIREMSDMAVRTHLPLEDFTKVITTNAESISKMGMGMTKGGTLVAGMAKKVYENNDALVGLYGNVTELSKGTADYLALQTQLGIDVDTDHRKQYEYLQEYLLRQKELSSITGKNAETIKREEEGRRKALDYNLKLGRLGDDAKANVQEGMAMAGKIFGDQGAKYAEEYFATGGKVYSQEALRYQAMNQEAAEAVAQMVSSVDTDRETYRKNNAQYLKDNAASLENYARSQEDMAELNRNAQNPLIKSQTETASAIIENLNLIKNSTDIFAQMAKDRAKMEGGKTPDDLSKVFVDSERQRLDVQRELDKVVIQNYKDLGLAMTTLNAITLSMAQAMGSTTETLTNFAKKGSEAAEVLSKKLSEIVQQRLTPYGTREQQVPERNTAGNIAASIPIDAVQEAIRLNEQNRSRPATPATPQQTTPETPNVPQREGGGITSGKTIAGENGAEAIIPLKNGTIPLKVDLTQLVQVMAEQTQLTKDVIRELQDNNDLTKKLIDYTT